ncbi:hypothetical protein A176_002981 [Myxococcus hansupus]|uniref:Uncharacterized protein n=1 Tax=Pseudomyxococcus hansupus TaxID=1297742 RepID=A0A0H4WTF4_9BACT|nr:hypothetical protein A176_002981 [Myxococcus hansupus]
MQLSAAEDRMAGNRSAISESPSKKEDNAINQAHIGGWSRYDQSR